ncbi:MAG: Glu-tRNA(Gln) amidotransferase subunit GatE [Thaumarchaeota archaeon]|jgi:glutamyl-tRNA(Gln) amidotransferase subunit E|nr:Glu-tRNA(Gln) amidotransferase subunit GatE [Candidatus Wolframiiraptor allenii]
MKIDYREIGLKVGLEIHRQLDTRHKLFCDCPTTPREGGREIVFIRWLREAQSELGEVDPAALFESRKRRMIVYHADTENTCLVELDEEPPHDLNREAVEIALTAALMMNARPVDEIHVMRKIVIDGSNTTGFQRTCVIALGGEIEVDGKKIPIQTITLEEDAARIIEQKPHEVHYDLSRLGIPLIEVSTAPVINSPEEAYNVAYAIGRILRATRRVKRGIGTVRQDLNISITGGALVEIKGVQELELLPKVVELEVIRQLHLLKIRDELRSRGVSEDDLKREPIKDVTSIFVKTSSKILRRRIEGGGVVLALRLKGFGGLLGLEAAPGIRLGAELAGRARAWSEVEGIFHTDELPGYGISGEEVMRLREEVGAGDLDAVVIVAAERERAEDALERVRERAIEALYGVPPETRGARPDGTTIYLRPRPGAARMYPETDIPPLPLPREYVEEIKRRLPPSLDEVAEWISRRYGVSKQIADELIDSEKVEIFERVVGETGIQPSIAASILVEHMKSLRREGYEVEKIREEDLLEFFRRVVRGELAKEAAPEIIKWLAQNPDKSLDDAVNALGLKAVSLEEVKARIAELMEANRDLVRSNPGKAISVIMGELMKTYRGRFDGGKLYQLVSQAVYGQVRD